MSYKSLPLRPDWCTAGDDGRSGQPALVCGLQRLGRHTGSARALLLMFGGATAATIITANDDDISMPSSISESATPTTNCEKGKNVRKLQLKILARYTAMIEAGSIAPPLYMDDMLIVEGNHRM